MLALQAPGWRLNLLLVVLTCLLAASSRDWGAPFISLPHSIKVAFLMKSKSLNSFWSQALPCS
jgi:hypothetical protein